MQIATVYSAVRILAESVASLPLRLFTMTEFGKTQELLNPLHHLLSVSPNEEMSSFTWIETLMAHLALTGNAYCEIQRAATGAPVAIWPLHPRETLPIRLPNGALAFKTTDGMTAGQSRILAAKDVLHVPLTSFDGIVGLSPIMQAKRSLGTAAAMDKFSSRFFSNFAMPQLALLTKKLVKPEDKMKMRTDWESLQSGQNQHRVAILDQEMTLEKISLNAEECQFLQTRQYTRSEIAALFRLPAHMIGSESKQTNSNVENMNLSFVVDTLRPYLSRIEAELTRKLLPREAGKVSTLTVGFDVAERLRGDAASQAAWATAGRNGGWLTANDVRRSQGLNEGGPQLDVYLYQTNMDNAERLLDAPKETVVPNEQQ
ncbi:phage portal protein [soil metagenome]